MEERDRLSIVRALGMMTFYSFSILPMLRRLLSRLLSCGLAAASIGAAAAPASTSPPKPMTLANYLALSGPKPSASFAYGSAPSQYVELFLPRGAGPFPVAVLVHGGCWTKEFGGITQLRNVAGALAARGIAAWNIEYRRVDEAGGGYPGTYQDMNAALAMLSQQAQRYPLDLNRLVAVGHSAGGQLVQWMAGRPRIPNTSPLYLPDPLPVKNVVSLGGLADLRREQDLIKSSCDREIGQLTGAPGDKRPDVFSDTNAGDLLPNGSRTILVTGELDRISPPRVARDYAVRARAAGDTAEVVILPSASHYDEVAASSASWPLVLQAIESALKP
jgi:acetyl esterase/lipase